MIITIDGPAGSGKSTVSKMLAQKIGFECFDTGAMYRAVTWYILENLKELSLEKDKDKIKNLLGSFVLDIRENDLKEKTYFVNNVDVTKKIRSYEITQNVSEVSKLGYIREFIVAIQRKIGRNKNIIFEGRDMGTVVFPYADIKFFLVASPEIRAKRRTLEISKKFPKLAESYSYKQILDDIKERDRVDSTRKISPLKKAEDAFLINTSKLSTKQVVETLFKRVKKEEKKKKRFYLNYTRTAFLYFLVIFSTRLFFKIFYKFKVYGRGNVAKGPAIIAANHSSFFDPPAVACAFPEEIHFLARKSLFKRRCFAWLIKRLNTHPLSRGSGDIATFKQIAGLLKKGSKVLLFPEGKRSLDGKIQNVMRGTGFLAYLSKSRIYPTYVHGAHKSWARSKKLPKLFGKISVVIGNPIDVFEFEGLSKGEFIEKVNERLKDSLINLQKWCEDGFKGDIP